MVSDEMRSSTQEATCTGAAFKDLRSTHKEKTSLPRVNEQKGFSYRDLFRSAVVSTACLTEANAVVESDGVEDLSSLVETDTDREDVLAARHHLKDLPIVIDGDLLDVTDVLACGHGPSLFARSRCVAGKTPFWGLEPTNKKKTPGSKDPRERISFLFLFFN
jgi:hypothetical protein